MAGTTRNQSSMRSRFLRDLSSPDAVKGHCTISERGCWIWNHAKNQFGYAIFTLQNRIICVGHRYVWQLCNGPIPYGLIICHHCDTPSCVNPDHLCLGTQKDNIRDMIQKGRMGWRPKGEQQHSSIFTKTQIREMRRMHSKGLKIVEIWPKFGGSYQSVRRAIRGISWAHIKN